MAIHVGWVNRSNDTELYIETHDMDTKRYVLVRECFNLECPKFFGYSENLVADFGREKTSF